MRYSLAQEAEREREGEKKGRGRISLEPAKKKEERGWLLAVAPRAER